MSAINFGEANAGFQAGFINGPVNTTVNVPHPRTQTPPRPTILIPFSRDEDYISRGDVLEQLQDRSATTGARIGLVGLGGIGKSQLAIEYAYRVRAQSPNTWVFWVHASNAARFEQSFRDIADCVKVPGREGSQVDIYREVSTWLRESAQPWLIVLDNVDDAEFLTVNGNQSSNSSRPLLDYLPHCNQGSVLVTSRYREAASKLVEEKDLIMVDVMTEAEATRLLEKKLGSGLEHSVVLELCTALEYMPLAIVQATAYIRQSIPRCSIRQYLDRLRHNDSQKTSLLDFEAGQLRRDRTASNSIMKTWQLSFEHLQNFKSSAADLLSLMSFFDRQAIPAKLLRPRHRRCRRRRKHDRGDPQEDPRSRPPREHTSQGCHGILSRFRSLLNPSAPKSKQTTPRHKTGRADESTTSKSTLEEDLRVLRSFCFIAVNPDGSTFTMHALIQLATRTWLSSRNKLDEWNVVFIDTLMDSWPKGFYNPWPIFKDLIPHVRAAANQQPTKRSAAVTWAGSLATIASNLNDFGHLTDAEAMIKKALFVQQKLLGYSHVDTLESRRTLGKVYRRQGLWDEAEKTLRRTLVTIRKVCGPGHLHTALVMQTLASVYVSQHRFPAAIELDRKVLQIFIKEYGRGFRDTIEQVHNLAVTHSKLRQYKQAEQLYLQELPVVKDLYGEDGTNTLWFRAELLRVYVNDGRPQRAVTRLPEVVDKLAEKLGVDHSITLELMGSLAYMYEQLDELDRAADLRVRLYELWKSGWGAQHPDTLNSMGNLAWNWYEQGRTSEALGLMREAVNLDRQAIGDETPDMLWRMDTLATWEQEHMDHGTESILSERFRS